MGVYFKEILENYGGLVMAVMTVYHGGYMPVERPEIRIGRNTKDFGTGFYCTVIKEQAQRWAKRYDTKIVSIYEVRINSKLNNEIPARPGLRGQAHQRLCLRIVAQPHRFSLFQAVQHGEQRLCRA